MRYVVRCENLEELKDKWDRIVSAHHDRVPNASFSPSAPNFQLLCMRLDRHPRITWFYYTETRNGVAIRLYDEEFRRQYPDSYPEPDNGDHQHWVILRGEHLGSSIESCKQQMLGAFDESWSATRAPSNDSTRLDETVHLGSSVEERIAYFQHALRNNASGENPVSLSTTLQTAPVQFEQSIADTLQQFKQIILYGPPGTGKTRLARRIATAVLNPGVDLEKSEEHLNQFLRVLTEQERFNLVVFHPAYEYEQFVGGISPVVTDDKPLGYEITPGIFLRMARAAEQHAQPAVLIIDEINRGNLPKLLGELLYALEYRTATVRLPFEWEGRSDLTVPHNLLLIGTMNSSDRSIGHIDVAVRRRFGLIHVEPDPSVVREFWSEFDAEWGERLARLMIKLNSELDGDRGGELRVDHAYFLANPTLPDLKQQVRRKWLFQVRQLLEEYRNVLNLRDDFLERYSGDLDAALW